MSQHTQIRLNLCYRPLLACVTLALILISNAQGQTSGFTYQGRLTDAGNPATGMYDFQFKLFDSTDFVTGTQQGPTLTRIAVEVTNGVFAVQLDFGAGVFDGSARFLEISLRPAGSPNPFTVLGPRQPATATPYAVRSVTAASAETAANATNATNATNAAQLGGIAASQYVVTSDARLSDARPPTAGSTNYVQNTTSQQATTNFNISGTGTASILNAMTQFNLGGARILRKDGLNNLFVGVAAGSSTTTGDDNNFFGNFTGGFNTTGSDNAFFGSGAGINNRTGSGNTFIGFRADFLDTFSTGDNNTLLGYNSKIGNPLFARNFINATAIGYLATVDRSNSLVLGSINGINGATADTNVGIGTTAPNARLDISANGRNILFGDAGCGPGLVGIGFASLFSGCVNYTLLGGDGNTYINRPTGGAIIFREANGPSQVEIRPGGFFAIAALDGGGSTQLCRNGVAAIATCSSSLRYKREIESYDRGLELTNRLRPITFTWKQDGMRDVGFGAEDVAAVEPLLITHNDKGEVEGVKYDRITVALVNAVREQQAQITQQKDEIRRQQAKIDLLKKLVCLDHPEADICKQAIKRPRA